MSMTTSKEGVLMMKKLVLPVCVFIVMVTGPAAWGFLLEYDPDGTGPEPAVTLVSENFEDCTVGAFPDNGRWVQGEVTGNGVDAVIKSSGAGSTNPAGPPGLPVGATDINYLEHFTPRTAEIGSSTVFHVNLPFEISSGSIHAEWMMYLADEPNSPANMLFMDFAEGRMADPDGDDRMNYAVYVLAGGYVFWVNLAEVPIIRGQWQKWEYDYNFGATNIQDRYWITVDGVTHPGAGPCDPLIDQSQGEDPDGRTSGMVFRFSGDGPLTQGGDKAGWWLDNVAGVEPLVTKTLTVHISPSDPCIPTTAVSPSGGGHELPQGLPIALSAERVLNCPAVYNFSHWLGNVDDPCSADTSITLDDNEVVTAVFVDGRACNDECRPYPTTDMNTDCYVTLDDFAEFADHWQECTDPGPPCDHP